MAWSKNVTKIAKATNDDVAMNFRVNDGYLMVDVRIDNDSPGLYADAVTMTVTGANQDAGLTGGERSSLVALLIKLRDEALAKLGYTNA